LIARAAIRPVQLHMAIRQLHVPQCNAHDTYLAMALCAYCTSV
jgi:hypothetical protein